MKKFLKASAIVIAVLFGILLLGPMLFKGKITELVKYEANQMLSAEIDFDGLDLSLLRHFPHASIEITGLRLVGDERFGGETIVAADRISAVVNVMSLFGDSGFEITKVILDKPFVNAVKLADGTVNWDIIKDDGTDDADAGKEEEKEEDAGENTGEPSSFQMQIKDFRITDAEISYSDDSTGLYFGTSPLSLRLQGDLSAAQTDLRLNLDLRQVNLISGQVKLVNNVNLALDADVAANLADNKFTFADNSLSINDILLKLNGWVDLDDDKVAMDLNAGCDKVLFKDILSLIPAFYTKDFKNLSADGELNLNLWAKGTLSEKRLPEFNLSASVTDGSFKYASLPKGVKDINIALKVTNPGSTMDKTVVDLSRFRLSMAGNSVKATLYATNLASDPYAKVTADGKFDLGAIKDVYPLDEGMTLEGLVTADLRLSGKLSHVEKQLYEKLGAEGTFRVEGIGATIPGLPQVRVNNAAASITPLKMNLSELDVKVGQSDIRAKGMLSGYLGFLMKGETLHGELDIHSNLMDLNEFMSESTTGDEAEAPAAGQEETTAEQPEANTAGGTIRVPENMDLRLSTVFREIRLMKMNITDLAGQMRVKNGTLSLDGLHLNIFDGKAQAAGRYSTAGDPQHPEVKLSLAFTDASFKTTFEQLDMIQKLVPVFAKTGGNYKMSANIHTLMKPDMSLDLMTLTADGRLASENIDLQQLEIFGQMAKLLKNDKLSQINTKDMDLRFNIEKGRIETQPFDIRMGKININMAGSTGLDQSIDYTARISMPENGRDRCIPVKIGGTFSSPQLSLAQAVTDLLEETAKNVVSETVNKVLGDKLPATDFESRAARIRENARKAGDKLVAGAEQERAKMLEKAAGQKAYMRKITEKAADKLVEEARRKADKLMQDAETRIEQMKQEQK